MSTGQEPPDLSAITGAQIGNPPIVSEELNKNPAAVALRRLGGLKGGKAQAEKLSARKRKQIATKAASARRKVKKDQKREV